MEIGGKTMLGVDAEELHTGLGLGRDWTNWIKDQIEKYRFIEGKNFTLKLAKSTGGRPASIYTLSLGSAKQIAIDMWTRPGWRP